MVRKVDTIPRVKKVKFDEYSVLGIDTTTDMCYDLRIVERMPMRYLATCLRELADKIDEAND